MSAAASDDARAVAIAESGWSYPVRFIQPHNLGFWVYIAIVLIGAHTFYAQLRAYSIYPSAVLIGLVIFALYALPFVWFIAHSDRYEREPAKLAVIGFIWGGVAATWAMALPGNGANLSIYAKLISIDFANSWGPPLTAPFVEESSKYVGLILLFILARNHVRSAYDGMLLGAFVGLGFQIFENFLYVVQGVDANFGSRPVQDAIQIFVLRGVSGLWSHALYTALAGAGLGYFIGARDRSLGHRLAVAAAFYITATIIHGSLDAVAAVGVIAIPITVITGTVALIVAWRFADGRQRRWMGVLLEDEVNNGTLSADELAVVEGKRKDRKRYLTSIKHEQGQDAARREGHVLDAITHLAAAIAGTNNPASPEAEAARAEIKRVRALPAT